MSPFFSSIGLHYESFVGTEEMAHLEMVGTILYQLTRCLSEEEIKKSGFDTYFIDHTTGVYPQAASGIPTDMKFIGVKGDVLADLHEDLAAEQKARVTYDNLLRLIDDRDVCEPLKFLRQREIVHYQRFGEANQTKLSGKEAVASILRTSDHPFVIPSQRFFPSDRDSKDNSPVLRPADSDGHRREYILRVRPAVPDSSCKP